MQEQDGQWLKSLLEEHMGQVQFAATDPEAVLAEGRSRRMRRRILGGAALTVMAIAGGTGVAMATGSNSGTGHAYTTSTSSTAHQSGTSSSGTCRPHASAAPYHGPSYATAHPEDCGSASASGASASGQGSGASAASGSSSQQ
jgi:hypothetical protein